jgi:hypothetical protein
VLFAYVRDTVVLTPVNELPESVQAPNIEPQGSPAIRRTGSCLSIEARQPSDAIVFRVRSGGSVYLWASKPTTAIVHFAPSRAFSSEASQTVRLSPAITRLTLPDLGNQMTWFLRYTPSPGGTSEVCSK